MITITIDNNEISNKYSTDEIKVKFIEFMNIEFSNEKVELFEISVDSLSDKSKKRLKNINNLKFINY